MDATLGPQRKAIRVGRHPVTVSRELLAELYAEVPEIECRQQCQRYCENIMMAGPEFDRIVATLGFTPRSDPGCPARCPMLTTEGLCSVRDIRPLICRLWGVTETMQCPWGCRPERYLTEAEAFALLLRSGAFAFGPMEKEAAMEFAQKVARQS